MIVVLLPPAREEGQIDIATDRMNQLKGRCSEKYLKLLGEGPNHPPPLIETFPKKATFSLDSFPKWISRGSRDTNDPFLKTRLFHRVEKERTIRTRR